MYCSITRRRSLSLPEVWERKACDSIICTNLSALLKLSSCYKQYKQQEYY